MKFALSSRPINQGASSPTQPLHQLFVRDVLSMFGFGRQNSGCAFFIEFFFGSFREAADELLIADRLPSIQQSQEGVDLTRRQGIYDFMKSG
jgi:hypothetical protein